VQQQRVQALHGGEVVELLDVVIGEVDDIELVLWREGAGVKGEKWRGRREVCDGTRREKRDNNHNAAMDRMAGVQCDAFAVMYATKKTEQVSAYL
jgi:hypothetical protein